MSPRSQPIVAVVMLLVLALAPPALATDPTPSPTAAAPPTTTVPSLTDAGPPSVHAQMLEEHAADSIPFSAGAVPLARTQATGGVAAAEGGIGGLPNGLFREVLGYLPYWMVGSDQMVNLDYSLVSTLAYFSVGANSNGTLAKTDGSGNPTTGWAGWTSSAMTDVTNRAHERDVKVVLTVTMMAWAGDYSKMSALLNSSTARSTLAGEIATAIRDRNADGVNLDFEPVPTSLRSQYTTFVREVKAALVARGAGSHVSVATMAGAATWDTGYDVAGLTAPGGADALMVMAYDFHWSGSARAGGVSPIQSPYIFDVADAIEDHLALVPASKLIWGVPYYGREWSTTSGGLNATTNDILDSRAYYYTFHVAEAPRRGGRQWDPNGLVPWYRYNDTAHGTWVEGYYDDVHSLTAKYDLVNATGLRGVGIWHLLMDGDRPELWSTIDASFQGIWFEDIVGSAFRNDILWAADAGITAGCGPERFCPRETVTREQMASFLARALKLPAATRDWFTDDAASAHQADINRVAESGVTAGCGAGVFCPRAGVTREQMASFLARALDLPATARDWFTDDDASAHEGAINRLAEAGIAAGCGSGRFCPAALVTREQMTAFLHRSFGD